MNTFMKFVPVLTFISAFCFAQMAFAQNPVQATHVDEKFANTTVVYKSTAASDKEVLESIENDFGIGDVIRVTVAPPQTAKVDGDPASAPVHADDLKGEETWLPKKSATADHQNLSSSADPAFAARMAARQTENTVVTPIYAAPAASKQLKITTNYVAPAKPAAQTSAAVAKSPEKQMVVESPVKVETPVAQKAEAPVHSKATGEAKTHKSVKKSGNKSFHKMKLKNRKPGKQRYSCPKF